MRMKYLASLLLIIFVSEVYPQDTIHYFNKIPNIDGYADRNLPDFKLTTFHQIEKSNKQNPDIKSGYYWAYNARFLYLYVEAKADSITFRDRGYQNGDGFHLVIGKPQKNQVPTDEFYVLGFSPGKTWCHKMIWYYNIALKMRGLSNETLFKSGTRNGKISFELLLPWKDVYPYHPWLSDSIGLNLCFVKAVGRKQKNYYFLKKDDKIQWEQSKRKYAIPYFEKPVMGPAQFASKLLRNHIFGKENIVLKVSGFTPNEITENFTIVFKSGENTTVSYKRSQVKFPAGLTNHEILIKNPGLTPGGYTVKVYCDKKLIGEHYLSDFPEIKNHELQATIRKLHPVAGEGTFHTLMFYLNDIDSSLNKLKNYETSFAIRNKVANLKRYVNELKAGRDLLSVKKGVYRRAYLSEKDNRLYPYSIYIPKDYSGDKKFPLLVYLHGSGDDDRILSRTTVIPEGFIVLAPSGLGTSNCFAGMGPQRDIEASIKDVISNFNIDTTQIILSGFSMGGYGVYRTYYEHPERYKAIAVISGHPDLARRWVDPNELNFLETKNLKKFRGIPIYIFHGKNDMNCPFSITEQLVKELRNNGCHVTFKVGAGGHGSMEPKIRREYFSWLKKQVE